MKKEEMTKIVNKELVDFLPPNLNEETKKLWRFAFNINRRKDLAQSNPWGGAEIATRCLNYIKENNPGILK